uniref:Reverse transcriptase domain-containing protein n=1 Tax=Haemonchus contortus TaxID=6289 RepID=A0A7I4Z6L7_HAECO
MKFRVLSSGVLEIFKRHGRERFSNMTNEQWDGLREVRKRVADGEIRLSVSDKGGEFVVLPCSLDREITELHLNDASVYGHSTEKAFLTQCHRLNTLWVSIGKTAKLDSMLIRRLKLDTTSCPVFYSLIKTHKLSNGGEKSANASDYKIRPIISCVGGPTDRISWFLNRIVGQLLRYVPSHLPNTNEFLDRLRSCRLQENCVVESFDVTALYTNVNNNEALQAVSEMLDEHETEIVTFGLSKVHIMALIKECLNCNIFKWSGQYFSQKRGLTMGQRLAPVLAICFMGRIERPVIARMPIMYCRYIDDCCVITSTQQEMDVLFDILNRQSQYIKFTREVPHEGWLPYLNTQIKISGGRYHVKWYRKNSSKNILLHAKSAHPEAVKRAVVRNMYRTATGMCTGEVEREESRKLACEIAKLNGYGTQRKRSGLKAYSPRNRENVMHLRLPFISDKVSAEIRQCIARADLANDVVLVNLPTDNIKRHLIRNRLYDRACSTNNCVICPFGKDGDCTRRGTVYQLQCSACDGIYIGETGRMLGIRVKEHLAGKRRGSLFTPLGKHRLEVHEGNDFDIKCKILAYENEIGARKILEALHIRERNPELNNRNECIAITGEFLPFIPLCGL